MHFSKFPLLSRIPVKLGACLHFALACKTAFSQSDYALSFSCTWRGNTNSTHHIANTRSGYWRLGFKIFIFFFLRRFFLPSHSSTRCLINLADVSNSGCAVIHKSAGVYIQRNTGCTAEISNFFFAAPNVQTASITLTWQGRGMQLSQHLRNPRSWHSNNLTFLRRG